MPTQKKKAKHQDATKPAAPAAVQIKSEPLDIKPLSAFVDDRVELIRQAFMCLKPKEITCLAPDAFQGKSIEFIQEQCLDEVLGISTKRLLSIINNTQCPTDTDSSDDEEEKITEHISLDEISSDSEVEIKPQPKKKAAKKTKSTDGKKTNNSTEASTKNGDKKSEKEMTVLELLELQARARAIRSQLAQEPVTKIELDSDEEAEKAAAPHPAGKKSSATNHSSTSAAPGTDAGGSSKQSSSSNRASPAKEQQPKRVRLKRNFRVRQVGDEDVPEEGSQPQQHVEESQKSVSQRESRSKSKEKEKVDKVAEEKTKEEVSTKSRDSSPEVIPVIPSPETLCISSDSEEEKERKKKASIFVDNIEELDRQAKEQAKQKEAKKAAEENDDTEEGEISEEERSRKESIGSTKADEEKKDSPEKDAKLDQEEELDYDEVREVSDSEPDTSGLASSLNQTDDQPETKTNTADDKSSDSSDSDAESSSSSSSSSSEGEPEVVEKSKKKEADEDEEDDPDIVEIHDSSDETLLDQKLAEDEPEKSWGSRWLESNRVAKVMAASRLGNKVRDKLKKKKKKQKQDEEDAAAAAKQAEEEKAEVKPAEEQQPVSMAEVGSVEHYNELMSKADKAEGDKDEAEKPE